MLSLKYFQSNGYKGILFDVAFVKLHFGSVSLRLGLDFPWRAWDEMLVLGLGVEAGPEATDGEEFAQGLNENGW